MATTYPNDPPVESGRSPHPHPVHAILAAYPLAFFTGALITDVIYVRTAQMMWANFSIWLITGGLLMGVFAALAGIVDAIASRGRRHERRTTRYGSLRHSLGTGLMLLLALVNAFVHSRDAWTSVVPAGLALSAIVTLLALVTSWQGYSIVPRQEVR